MTMQLRSYTALLLSSVFTVGAAQAADLIIYPEPMTTYDEGWVAPAVSGVNGKFELDLGYLTNPSSAAFRGAGSISLPIGERFGLQGDVSVQNFAGEWSLGGAVHAFTRDPSSYLFGITAGAVATDDSMLMAIGPEAELYLDRVSLEGWAGIAALEYDDPFLSDLSGWFAIGDVAFYPDDDWRLSVGGSSILGEGSLRVASEYQFAPDMGLALAGEGRWFDTGALQGMVGLKGYLGEPGKSLIDRHRQDDPPNRALSLFAGASELISHDLTPDDIDNESDCWDAGFYWENDDETDGDYCVDDRPK